MTNQCLSRFIQKTDFGSALLANQCWIWMAATDAGGYGRFWGNGRLMRAHRFAWEQKHGPIPPGLQIDHLCRVRNCVNPGHMEVVTRRDNILRGVGFSALEAKQTHCKRGHEFTPENLYHPPSQPPHYRRCVACDKQHSAALTLRRKLALEKERRG